LIKLAEFALKFSFTGKSRDRDSSATDLFRTDLSGTTVGLARFTPESNRLYVSKQACQERSTWKRLAGDEKGTQCAGTSRRKVANASFVQGKI